MSVVVDASVAVSWFVKEPNSAVNRELMRNPVPLFAPELLRVETTNALIRKVRRSEFVATDIDGAWAELANLKIVFVPDEDLLGSATRMALQFNHSLYDCIYLALAQLQGASLATDDRHVASLAEMLLPSVPIWRPSVS